MNETETITLPPRFTTGVPGLDPILGGGFLENGTYLIEGGAGTGKTVLASQIAFKLVKEGKRVLYLTIAVESHAKLLRHISALRFFDSTYVAKSLTFLSALPQLKAGGFAGLLEMIAKAVRDYEPYLIVIDGFRMGAGATAAETEEFVHQLGALASTASSTVLLLAPVGSSHQQEFPEHVAVDGIIDLSRYDVGLRTVRKIEIRKLRASDHLLGRHFFLIGESGVTVFPRFEGLAQRLALKAKDEDWTRLAFGIPRLDAMLHGGVTLGSTTGVLGAPGTGKTLLGLNFLLAGAREGQRGLYFGFYEVPERLMRKAEGIGLNLRAAVNEGLINILWQPPLEYLVDQLAYKLLEAIEGMKAQRLFIDGIDGFFDVAVYPARIPRFLAALTNHVRASNVTTLVSEELPIFTPRVENRTARLSVVIENILLLRHVELRSQLHRLISVMKWREGEYDSSIREFTIRSSGIDVASSFTSAEAILSGNARAVGSHHPRQGTPPEDTREPSS